MANRIVMIIKNKAKKLACW